jgi:DNA-binding MarR family transcriptional regulator
MVVKGESHTCGPHSIGRLLAHIYKYTQNYMSEHLDEYDLSGPTYGYLFFLYHKDGISEKTITDHMLVDKATTTRAISKLESYGYVRKEKDRNDKRSYRVYLTEKAEKLRPKLRTLRNEWNELVLGCLEERERKILLDLLTRIEMNLQNTRKEGDSS